MHERVTPSALLPRGVYESPHYSVGGGVILSAINDEGVCVDYAIVFTRGDYWREQGRLNRVLEGAEAPLRTAVSGGVSLAIVR